MNFLTKIWNFLTKKLNFLVKIGFSSEILEFLKSNVFFNFSKKPKIMLQKVPFPKITWQTLISQATSCSDWTWCSERPEARSGAPPPVRRILTCRCQNNNFSVFTYPLWSFAIFQNQSCAATPLAIVDAKLVKKGGWQNWLRVFHELKIWFLTTKF